MTMKQNEIDELGKEVYCETCKYFDIGYGVCRHPIAIKDDVGEKDSCNLWWGRD